MANSFDEEGVTVSAVKMTFVMGAPVWTEVALVVQGADERACQEQAMEAAYRLRNAPWTVVRARPVGDTWPECARPADEPCEGHCEVCGAHEGQMHLVEECLK